MSNYETSIQSRVQDSYNLMAEEYTDWVESKDYHPARIQYVDKMLSLLQDEPGTNVIDPTSRATILELGCGAGVPVTAYLGNSDRVGSVVANDLSEKQIELAKQRVPARDGKVQFVAGDMLKLNFENESFDGIAAFFSIFHLPLNEQKTMFEKVFAWLRPGGVLVCNLGATASDMPDAMKDAKDDNLGCFFGKPMFWANLGTNASTEMIKGVGFEILESDISDTTDGGRVVTESDVDAGIEFVWFLARKPDV